MLKFRATGEKCKWQCKKKINILEKAYVLKYWAKVITKLRKKLRYRDLNTQKIICIDKILEYFIGANLLI